MQNASPYHELEETDHSNHINIQHTAKVHFLSVGVIFQKVNGLEHVKTHSA